MKRKPNANTRTLRPDNCLVVLDLKPAPRPAPPSRNWLQIRHHQDRPAATGQTRFTRVLPAILAGLVSHAQP